MNGKATIKSELEKRKNKKVVLFLKSGQILPAPSSHITVREVGHYLVMLELTITMEKKDEIDTPAYFSEDFPIDISAIDGVHSITERSQKPKPVELIKPSRPKIIT